MFSKSCPHYKTRIQSFLDLESFPDRPTYGNLSELSTRSEGREWTMKLLESHQFEVTCVAQQVLLHSS